MSSKVFFLTHAGYDAVHRQPGWGIIEASKGETLPMFFLLFEDEGRVFLFSDVDVVAGVSSSHDVTWSRIQEDALVVLPLYPNQTDPIPARQFKMGFNFSLFCLIFTYY